jgi:hypothetical protein
VPSALDTIARVHRAIAVRDGSDAPDAAWLAETVRRWAAGRPGKAPWACRARRRDEDAAPGTSGGGAGAVFVEPGRQGAMEAALTGSYHSNRTSGNVAVRPRGRHRQLVRPEKEMVAARESMGSSPAEGRRAGRNRRRAPRRGVVAEALALAEGQALTHNT